MTFRTRKEQHAYKKYQKTDSFSGCVFCKFHPGHNQIVRETENFWVCVNIFPYSQWEGLNVLDHLMVLPKKHKDSLKKLTPKELAEYAKILAEYDAKGYSSYMRSTGNVSKSVAHSHAHLLKLGEHKTKVSIYLSKPYFLWWR